MKKVQVNCPVTAALSALGGKWKVVILWHLQGGVKRFGELRRLLVGVSQKILTQELRELESTGLVRRKVYAEVPPRVEYALTEFGQTVSPLLKQMAEWGKEYIARLPEEAKIQGPTAGKRGPVEVDPESARNGLRVLESV